VRSHVSSPPNLIDTYSKVVCTKLYDRKTPITAADLLNDLVIPTIRKSRREADAPSRDGSGAIQEFGGPEYTSDMAKRISINQKLTPIYFLNCDHLKARLIYELDREASLSLPAERKDYLTA
jgi:hypothetical protein